jgi:hypothetical protein
VLHALLDTIVCVLDVSDDKWVENDQFEEIFKILIDFLKNNPVYPFVFIFYF